MSIPRLPGSRPPRIKRPTSSRWWTASQTDLRESCPEHAGSCTSTMLCSRICATRQPEAILSSLLARRTNNSRPISILLAQRGSASQRPSYIHSATRLAQWLKCWPRWRSRTNDWIGCRGCDQPSSGDVRRGRWQMSGVEARTRVPSPPLHWSDHMRARWVKDVPIDGSLGHTVIQSWWPWRFQLVMTIFVDLTESNRILGTKEPSYYVTAVFPCDVTGG